MINNKKISYMAIPGSIRTVINYKAIDTDNQRKMVILKSIISAYLENNEWSTTNSKVRKHAEARQLYSFFATKYRLGSDSVIGRSIGRHRSSVIAASKKAKELCQVDRKFRMVMQSLELKVAEAFDC